MPVAKKRKSPARQARQAAYRTLVLEAAERVFAVDGFDGAKIKDVADRAGLALGTVYALFPGKRDVFIAVHALRGGLLLERIVAAVDGIESPLAALVQAQRVTCAFYAEHPFYLQMHLCSGTSWATPRLDVDEEQRVFESGVRSLTVLFERAATLGELIDEPPATCARMCLALMQVILGEWHVAGLRASVDEVAATCARLTLRTFARARAA